MRWQRWWRRRRRSSGTASRGSFTSPRSWRAISSGSRPATRSLPTGSCSRAPALRLDESILSGESAAVERAEGEEVRSGSFVVEGSGSFEVAAVGAESYAERIAGTAREFRHPRSPLERSIDRLLYVLLAVMVPLGIMLIVALRKQDVVIGDAVDTAVAGMVTLVPEGLILLVSVTYAAAALRMARVGALSQQLNAIESLASVDTICVDKTGTLTTASLRLVEVLPARGHERGGARRGARPLRGLLRGAESDADGDRSGAARDRGAGRRDRAVPLPPALERPGDRRHPLRARRARDLPARGARRCRRREPGSGPPRRRLRCQRRRLPGGPRCRSLDAADARARGARRGAASGDARDGCLPPRAGRRDRRPLRRRRPDGGLDRDGCRHPGSRARARRRGAPRRATQISTASRARCRSWAASRRRESGGSSSRSAATGATWRWSGTGSTTSRR